MRVVKTDFDTFDTKELTFNHVDDFALDREDVSQSLASFQAGPTPNFAPAIGGSIIDSHLTGVEVVHAADPALDGGKVEIAFIDGSVAGYQMLVADVRPGVETVVINGTHGLEKIAAYLQGRTDVSAIHIMSHGNAGVFTFGTEDVSNADVAAYRSTLAEIGGSLHHGGDLLLYGCNVGAGPSGETLIDQISSYAKADTAASTDLTGAAKLGGDWDLEFHVGTIDVATAITAVSGANYNLALTSYTFTDGPGYKGGTSIASVSETYQDLTIKETDPVNHFPIITHTTTYGLEGEGGGTFDHQYLDITKTNAATFAVTSLDVFGGFGTSRLGQGTGGSTDPDGNGSGGFHITILAFNSSHVQIGSDVILIANTATTSTHVDLSGVSGFSSVADLQVSAEGYVYVKNLVLDGGPTNTPPTANADMASSQAIESGSAVTGNVLTNDSDPDSGDTISVTAIANYLSTAGTVGTSLAGHYGHLTVQSDGSYSYVADQTSAIDGAGTGSHLTDVFTYTVSDNHGATASTTLTVTLDRAPTVVTDNYGTIAEGASTGAVNAASGVLTNDSDRDGDSLTVTAIAGGTVGVSTATTYGHITLNSDGSYSYTADGTSAINSAATGSHPVDTVSFTVSDGHGGTTSETLNFTIDRAPTTLSDSGGTVAEGGTAIVNAASGVLTDDSDRDGDSLTVTAVKNFANVSGTIGSGLAGTYGTLTLFADGHYSYTADNISAIDSAGVGSHPVDTYTITVGDGHGGATIETLDFTIDRAGVANSDGITTTETSTVTASTRAAGLLGNDVDPDTNDNTGLAVTAVNGSGANVGNQVNFADGSFITVNADGTYTYDPNHAWDFLPSAASGAPSVGTETFTYTIAGGSTVTVTITINGQDSDDTLYGSAGNDVFSGGLGNDSFRMKDGGDDIVNGGSGNDTFAFRAAFTSADQVDGGTNVDQVILDGNYAGAHSVTFDATTMVNVEKLGVTGGHDYDLTTDNATVASGQTLTVYANTLGAGDTLTFDGTAETNGSFVFRTGAGTNVLTGGGGDDSFIVNQAAVSNILHGGGGDDVFSFYGNLTAATQVDGGMDTDRVVLNGDYSGGLTFTATTMVNVEQMFLSGGHSYDLTTDDATVASGETLRVNATTLGAGDHLDFDGSAESDGSFVIAAGAGDDTIIGGTGKDTITGGDGADTITGGGGGDILTGGTGADQFVYNAVSDFTSVTFDQIRDFDALSDTFKLSGFFVNVIDPTVTSGHLGGANFDTQLAAAIGASQLSAHDAVVFTPDIGSFHGHTFLIVDVNGTAGYQAGQDFVFDITGATNLANLTTADFVS